MKKLLSLALVALLAFVACEPSSDDQGVSGTMQITTESPISYSFVGGPGEITYTLEGAKKGDMPSVECAQEWITALSVADKITFNVERSSAQEERTAIIIVKYGEQEEQVFVKQGAAYEPAKIEVEAKALNGEYLGQTSAGTYNYFIILSENGTTGWFDLYVDNYYRLSLCSDVAPADLTPESPSVLPVGVYYIDELSMGGGGTFKQSSSWYVECRADGGFFESQYSNGVVIVTETGIEASLTLTDGTVHHVMYEGSLDLGYIPFPEPDYYTSLTEDYIFEHNGFVSQIYYYADIDNVGLGNWVITAANSYDANMNGDYLKVDVYLDSLEFNPELIYGEYDAVATYDELKGGNFLGGVKGSWLYGIEDGFIVNGTIAPLATGKVKIEKSGNGAIITVDCVDDLGHKVQGTFDCPTVEFYDLSK